MRFYNTRNLVRKNFGGTSNALFCKKKYIYKCFLQQKKAFVDVLFIFAGQ